MVKVRRINGGIIHRIADCNVCSWRDEGQYTASKLARKHTAQTGHTTSVENGQYIIYKATPPHSSQMIKKKLEAGLK